MQTKQTAAFEIPEGREFHAGEVIPLSGSDLADVDQCVANAVLDTPNAGGWQRGRCNGWEVSMRGRKCFARLTR